MLGCGGVNKEARRAVPRPRTLAATLHAGDRESRFDKHFVGLRFRVLAVQGLGV